MRVARVRGRHIYLDTLCVAQLEKDRRQDGRKEAKEPFRRETAQLPGPRFEATWQGTMPSACLCVTFLGL